MRHVKRRSRQFFPSSRHLHAGIAARIVQRKLLSAAQQAGRHIAVRRNRKFRRRSIHEHRIRRRAHVHLRFLRLCGGGAPTVACFAHPFAASSSPAAAIHTLAQRRENPRRARFGIPAQGIVGLDSEKK